MKPYMVLFYAPKRGWRLLLARLLRRPTDEVIWIGGPSKEGPRLMKFTSSGTFTIEDNKE